MSAVRAVMKWLLSALFVVAGVNHFLRPDFYASIMPRYLPWHIALVYLSGIVEIVLGTPLLLVPRFQAAAAWGLVGLLIGVFPANVHMAVHANSFPSFHPVVLWIRLPLQAILIAWAYGYTLTEGGGRAWE